MYEFYIKTYRNISQKYEKHLGWVYYKNTVFYRNKKIKFQASVDDLYGLNGRARVKISGDFYKIVEFIDNKLVLTDEITNYKHKPGICDIALGDINIRHEADGLYNIQFANGSILSEKECLEIYSDGAIVCEEEDGYTIITSDGSFYFPGVDSCKGFWLYKYDQGTASIRHAKSRAYIVPRSALILYYPTKARVYVDCGDYWKFISEITPEIGSTVITVLEETQSAIPHVHKTSRIINVSRIFKLLEIPESSESSESSKLSELSKLSDSSEHSKLSDSSDLSDSSGLSDSSYLSSGLSDSSELSPKLSDSPESPDNLIIKYRRSMCQAVHFN